MERPESDLKITYLIFPGTAEKPNAPPNLDHWHDKCRDYLKELGAPGSGHELHRWEDPFKKPLPIPAVTTAADGSAGVSPNVVPAAMPAMPAVPTTPVIPSAAKAP
jgi:hypothetical protein